MTPLLLAVDTTHEYGSLALLRGAETVEEVLLHAPAGFAHVLYPHLGGAAGEKRRAGRGDRLLRGGLGAGIVHRRAGGAGLRKGLGGGAGPAGGGGFEPAGAVLCSARGRCGRWCWMRGAAKSTAPCTTRPRVWWPPRWWRHSSAGWRPCWQTWTARPGRGRSGIRLAGFRAVPRGAGGNPLRAGGGVHGAAGAGGGRGPTGARPLPGRRRAGSGGAGRQLRAPLGRRAALERVGRYFLDRGICLLEEMKKELSIPMRPPPAR